MKRTESEPAGCLSDRVEPRAAQPGTPLTSGVTHYNYLKAVWQPCRARIAKFENQARGFRQPILRLGYSRSDDAQDPRHSDSATARMPYGAAREVVLRDMCRIARKNIPERTTVKMQEATAFSTDGSLRLKYSS